MLSGFVPGAIVIEEFLRTGLVLRIPSAILAVGLVLSGVLTLHLGVMLHSIGQRFREIDRRVQTIAAMRFDDRQGRLRRDHEYGRGLSADQHERVA